MREFYNTATKRSLLNKSLNKSGWEGKYRYMKK